MSEHKYKTLSSVSYTEANNVYTVPVYHCVILNKASNII